MDPDTGMREFGGPGPGESLDRRLGNGVGAPSRVSGDGRVRGHVDDHTLVAEQHSADQRLGQPKWSDDVDLQHVVEGGRRIVGKVGKGRGPELRGVVHQDVNAAETFKRERNQPLEIARRAHIGWNRKHAPAEPPNLAGYLLEGLLAPSAKGQRRALTGEGERDCSAKSARRSGDKRDLSLKRHRRSLPRRSRFRWAPAPLPVRAPGPTRPAPACELDAAPDRWR